ncbi:MAG TPA: type I methionyl aminopeptidase [Pinirhizobacter sp.]|uniref:type I methionyl aminopeptidase n=1 Tax=Pinirhizobacter sp. TaxID=2950432 RepID=UPI002CDE691F|nr:type I methionyl aminopeptidase [Pinirhizobacter sp.]HMH66951.1 type I methionyl aminopeptidase [Pinirhizobacter sp.]
MAVIPKTPEEIQAMRVAGALAADVLAMLKEHVRPGVSTEHLDRLAHDYIVDVQKAIPANVGYRGFPKTVCTSVNHVICHGIPTESKVLKDGDIVNIDVTVIKDGWHGDTSRMYFVGAPGVLARRLVDTTYEAMMLGIGAVRPGATLGDVGAAIQKHAEAAGFSVVREYCGHGIGKVYHDEPQVLHYGRNGTGLELKPGMTFTVEPMINAGKPQTKQLPDGWTVVTKDHSLSAQWEHTVAVTESGFEILTPWPDAA